MNNFNRLFGSGIWGLLISLGLLYIAKMINELVPVPKIFDDQIILRTIIFGILSIVCIFLIINSFRILQLESRGRVLITTGVFHYFRHPLYAAFITFFDFGLAIYLNKWTIIIWAIILHPIWHLVVRSEEKMMGERFKDQYINYCKTTGRFFPRIITIKSGENKLDN